MRFISQLKQGQIRVNHTVAIHVVTYGWQHEEAKYMRQIHFLFHKIQHIQVQKSEIIGQSQKEKRRHELYYTKVSSFNSE